MVDFPTAVQAPRAASYAAPLLDFSPLAKLPELYFQGQQNKLKLEQQNAFRDGIPLDAQGNPDFNAVAKTLAGVGMPDQAIAAAREGAGQRALTGLVDQVGGGNAPSAPQPAAGGLSNAAGIPAASPGAGAPAGYTERVASAESGGNANARNPNSTATGLFQFTEGTWNDLAQKYPKLGLTPDGRTDPEQQRRAMAVFTRDNAATLQAGGVAPNDRSLYLAHFLGAGGAGQFMKGLSANPNAPAAALVAPEQAEANATLFYNKDGSPRSALDFYKNLTAKAAGPNEGGVAQIERPQGGAQPGQAGPGQGGGFTPQFADQLRALIASGDPKARDAALGLLQTELAPQYTFQTLPDGTVVRMSARGGTVAPVYQSGKPAFGQIGEDMLGSKSYGFIDATKGTVTPVGGQGMQPIGQTVPGVPGGINSDLKGDAYLAQFPKEIQASVKNYIDGKSMPTGNPRRGYAELVQKVAAKYAEDVGDSVDATTFAARRQMRTGLSQATAGSLGGQLNIGNTAIGHLADLSEKAVGLGNVDWGIAPLSAAVNTVRGLSSAQNAKLEALRGAAQHYGQEITKFYAGSPGGEGERNRFLSSVDGAKTPQALAAVLETEAELMQSRLGSLASQIKGTLGDRGAAQYPVVRPESAKALEHLQRNVRKLRGESEPAPAVPQTGPGEAVAAPGGAIGEGATATNPQTGQKIIFKGGQWQPAQ